MKKTAAILLAVLALSALSVTALAASSPEQEPAEADAPVREEAVAALTEEQALAVALKDAGFEESEVTVDRSRLTEKTTVDGEAVAVYSVKLSNDTTTCRYYIDANTGAILYKSLEFRSADIVFAGGSHSRGGTGGEMDGEASGEMGRSGRRQSASAEPEGSILNDTAAA